MNGKRKIVELFCSLASISAIVLTGCAPARSSVTSKPATVGRAHIQEGHDVLAKQKFRSILAERPDDPVAHYELGRIESLRGNAAEARMHFEKVLSKQPYNAAAHADLGWALVQLNELSQAQKHFDRALDLGDQEGLAWVGLGAVYLERHEPKRAYKALNKALSFNPRDPLAHYYLGQYYGKQRNQSRAMEHYRICSGQDNPMRGAAYYELACCYADLKKDDAALNALKQAARYGFKDSKRVFEDPRFKPHRSQINEIFQIMEHRHGADWR